jgi:hypothetical protein
MNATSRIDAASLLFPATYGTAVDLVHPVQKQLGREVNPKTFTIREWKSKLKAKDAFVREVAGQPKIFLVGNEHELAEHGRRKP